jgi:hypothetical protein
MTSNPIPQLLKDAIEKSENSNWECMVCGEPVDSSGEPWVVVTNTWDTSGPNFLLRHEKHGGLEDMEVVYKSSD